MGGTSGAPMTSTCSHFSPRSEPWAHGLRIAVPMGDSNLFDDEVHRYGEALHPGPNDLYDGALDFCTVPFGCSNPSGLRRKETEAVGLGAGVWTYSETQLSARTLPTCAYQLRRLASQQHRSLQVLPGAAVAPRTSSEWAGSWSGVLTTSDFKARPVHLPWPPGLYESGRICASRHMIGALPFLVVAIYGYPRGPTFPSAPTLNRCILDFLTREVLVGHAGPRLIMGDFNLGAHDSPAFDEWRSLGWKNAQQHAADLFGWTPIATSKGRKERDMIWLSPEALRLMKGFSASQPFAEHTTLQVDLAIPSCIAPLRTWPLPQKIPWEKVDDSWTPPTPTPSQSSSSTHRLALLFQQFEGSLLGHVPGLPQDALPPLVAGRAQRVAPRVHEVSAPLSRPSRAGEVRLRSDFVGNEVRRWFRQLRRLQALRQSLEAGNFEDSAVLHRINLWSAILRAPGFSMGFRTWWQRGRRLGHERSPQALPYQIPDLIMCIGIFEIFRANFDQLESWHLRQRGKQLRLKHDRAMRALYHELRDPAKAHPSLFFTEHDHRITQINENGLVLLDPVPELDPLDSWKVGPFCSPAPAVEGEYLDFGSDFLLQPGALAQRTSYLHTTSEVHQALLDHWVPRWQSHVQPTEEEWSRITGLFQRLVPSLDFNIGRITEKEWRSALKRYTERSARGLDGISHLDLVHMPSSYVQPLLDLIHDIEMGVVDWPLQILHGVCFAIAKKLNAHSPGDFRPIVVFSIIYRTWGAIRSRQLLHQMAPLLPAEQLGFLPHREPLELWLNIQSHVEESLSMGQDLQGISTDITRAFNCIPRDYSKALAVHIGVPTCIVDPWMSFLAGCKRAFMVDGSLSDFVGSDRGMPEGCALSVFSMVQIDWAFHLYLSFFSPKITCMSFVDNLVLKSNDVGALMGGWAALQTFFELWGLQLDSKKTYSWALSTESRQTLQLMDLAVVLKATELGGGMHFSGRRSTVHFQDRCSQLESKWLRLQHSQAPMALKQRALYTVFWPKAFHGINATPLPAGSFTSLRTRALKSLRLSKAGTNPLLRLSLGENCKCDPGYYYVSRLLQDFTRLCGKDRSFSSRWHMMTYFDGTANSGPFATLTYAVNSLDWRVEPPFIIDHDGIPHDMALLDSRLLERSLHEAWLQHVSRVAKKRHLMADLDGLDLAIAPLSSSEHSALDLARLRALQAGTFLAAASQAKFDLSKRSRCRFCGQPDTHVHWLSCPGYVDHRPTPWPTDLDSWPLSLRAHLLPSRNPHTHDIKVHLHTLHTAKVAFFSEPTSGPQHLFTDGALQRHSDSWLNLASWAVVNASSGLPVSSGPLPGLLQEIDVAEIYAIKVALSWAVHWKCAVHLWVDSKFAADSVNWLLHQRWVPHWWANQVHWQQIRDLLDQLEDSPPCVHWIPSHVPAELLRDPFEDWWATWNQRVDFLATQANE